MDTVLLSRWQFATTTIYHFFFVPLTLGLVWFLAVVETLYVYTGNETYKRMAQFWGKLFLINFAMGVVTGLVQEFQFGLNWSEYSRFMGDIFGVPLAMEALLAFFMESTFLGVWVFGWGKLPKKLHAAVIWLVALGSSFSALFILLANGFMQHPVGYRFNEALNRLELVDFGALAANPRGWLLFGHAITAGLATGGFFVVGISAYRLLKGEHVAFFRKSFQVGAVFAIVGASSVFLLGHTQGIYLLGTQPMAAAASEAHYETANPAPFKVAAWFDASGKRETWSLEIPGFLNMLYLPEKVGTIRGIDDIQQEYETRYGPGDYVPLVALDFWMFRIMVGVWLLMMAAAAYALYLWWKGWPEKGQKWLKWLAWSITLPYLANTAGWLLTETARQPWVVHGLLRTEDAVSPNVTPGMVLFSLIAFALLYGLLMVVDARLLLRAAKTDPAAALHS